MSTSVRTTILPWPSSPAPACWRDVHLPAVSDLQRDIDISVAQGQATIAVFLASPACSQLVWGEALHRFGPQACVKAGPWLLVASSAGSALAPELNSLLAMLLQGIAAGASTVVSPTVIRATLPAQDGVRGIAAVSVQRGLAAPGGPDGPAVRSAAIISRCNRLAGREDQA
jgi:DHA1 family bicyclomycin/chloramphenicol resistance-like MFS transporter